MNYDREPRREVPNDPEEQEYQNAWKGIFIQFGNYAVETADTFEGSFFETSIEHPHDSYTTLNIYVTPGFESDLDDTSHFQTVHFAIYDSSTKDSFEEKDAALLGFADCITKWQYNEDLGEYVSHKLHASKPRIIDSRLTKADIIELMKKTANDLQAAREELDADNIDENSTISNESPTQGKEQEKKQTDKPYVPPDNTEGETRIEKKKPFSQEIYRAGTDQDTTPDPDEPISFPSLENLLKQLDKKYGNDI